MASRNGLRFVDRWARRWFGARRPRRRLGARLCLESLEDRLTPAAISWDGGGGNFDWNNALNWSSNTLPGAADDVTIDVPAAAITVVHGSSSGSTTINSLVTAEALDLTGGTLTVVNGMTIRNTFSLAGGTLRNTMVSTDNAATMQVTHGTSATATLDGVTLGVNTTIRQGNRSSGNQVKVFNGLTLANNAVLLLERLVIGKGVGNDSHDVGLNFDGGAQRLDGVGEVHLLTDQGFGENDVRVRSINGGSLTIGAGVTVRGQAYSVGGDPFGVVTLGDSGHHLTIEGKVSSGSSSGTLRVKGLSVTNTGTLESLSGELDVDGLSGNANAIHITNGDVDLDGTYTVNLPVTVPTGTGSLTLRGNWVNATTITQQGGTVNLGGTFQVADLGTLPTTGTGGKVSIIGVLDDPGATLLLDTARTWQVNGGTVRGVNLDGGAGRFLEVTSAGGTLDGATLGINTTIREGAGNAAQLPSGNQVTVFNGLTLANNAILRLERTVLGTNSSNDSYDVGLNFNGGAQTLGGVGEVRLFTDFGDQANDIRVRPTGGGSLTIGAGVTVRSDGTLGVVTLGDSAHALTIEGKVLSSSSAAALRVTGLTVTNNGTFQAVNALLDVTRIPTNFAAGTLTGGVWQATNGGDVRLPGGVAISTLAATVILDGAGSNFEAGAAGSNALSALAGIGATGSLTIQSGRNLATPGALTTAGNLSIGAGSTLTVAGDSDFVSGATLGFGLNSPYTTAGTHYGQMIVNGAVNLGDATLNLFGGAVLPARRSVMTLISNDAGDAVSGTFNNLADNEYFTLANLSLVGRYAGGSGNDVVLVTTGLTATENAGNLTIADAYTTGDANQLTITRIGDTLQIRDAVEMFGAIPAGATVSADRQTLTIPLAGLTSLTINGGGGNDVLTVDLSNGNPIPAGGLVFNGGDPTSGVGDALVILGGAQGTVTYNHTNASDGSVVMSNFGTITYTGLEPITNTGSATDIIFNLPAVANAATLEDDGTSGNGLSRLSGATFETTDFANPSNSLTINRGNAADTLTVGALPDFDARLTFGSSLAPFATVQVTGAVSLGTDNSLELWAAALNVTAAAAVSVTGSGTLGLTVDALAIAAAPLNADSSILIQPLTAGRTISLGTEVPGTLSLTETELSRIAAPTLQIGSTAAGNITVSEHVNLAASPTLHLRTGGSILDGHVGNPVGGDFEFALSIGAGNGEDRGLAVATDGNGDVLVAGTFDGLVDFDPGPGTVYLTSFEGDAFLAKYSSAGALIWVRAFGGEGLDEARAVAVDSAGNVYTTGLFAGSGDFDPGLGVTTLTSAGGNDVFVSKFDPAGNLLFAVRMGGTGADEANALAVDAAGHVYTTGRFSGTVDFNPGAGTTNLTSAGGFDIFVSRLDSAGNFVFAVRLGGTSTDEGNGIAIDSAGNVLTTGQYEGTVDFDPGAGTSNLVSTNGNQDIFISKLNSAGNFVFARGIGGISLDEGNAIAVDSAGSVYTTGYFNGTVDFDPGAGVSNLVSAGGAGDIDIFVSKLDSAGNFVYARRLGGTTADLGTGITVDAAGSVYTTGQYGGTADFDPGAGTSNLTSAGGFDIFVSKLNSAGNFVFARSLGGTTTDQAAGIRLDAAGNIYTTGNFTATADFDPGAGSNNLTSAGGNDLFVSKLDSAGNFGFALGVGAPTGDDEFGHAVVSDGDFVYVAIEYHGGLLDFDPGPGLTLVQSLGGGTAVLVAKFTAAGELVWVRQMGGTGTAYPTDIAVDGLGNVYTTGKFSNAIDFDPGPGATVLTSGASTGVFISKLDADGTFVWAHGLATADNSVATVGIAADGSGNVYVTGAFSGTVDFDPGAGVSNLISAGGDDIFVTKLDSAGNLVFAVRMGGTSTDEGGRDVAVDASGNVYTTGAFFGTADFNPGAGTNNLTSAGGTDIFLSKLDTAGNFVFARRIGGTSNDSGWQIAVDLAGNVYPAGQFIGTVDFDPGAGVRNLTSGGGGDAFVSKYDSAGNFIYASRLGGAPNEVTFGLGVDSFGNAYSTGLFSGTLDFDPGAGISNLVSAGSFDAYVWALDPAGNLRYARRMGGAGDHRGRGLGVDPAGNVYTTGSYLGRGDYDPGSDTFNLTSVGGADFFLQKLTGPSVDVVATTLVLEAASGVGATGDALELDVQNLAASIASGSVVIANRGGVTIAALGGVAGVMLSNGSGSNGALAASFGAVPSDLVVSSGATLRGTGTVLGRVTVQSGGSVVPGHSPGVITINGSYVQNAGGTLDIEIQGTNPAVPDFDQLIVNGTVTLGGTLNVSFLNGFTPGLSDSFTIIVNDGADAVSGTFAGLPEGATFTVGGHTFQISYTGGDGNDVALLPPTDPLIVTTALDVVAGDGLTSLREAILYANANPGLDTIRFNIPGAGAKTINVGSTGLGVLPTVTDAAIIDAYSQPGASPNTNPTGFNGTLLIELNGTLVNGDGLTITAGNSTVRGLVINRFDNAAGIRLTTNGNNVIEGNFLGTDVSGTAASGNADGLRVVTGSSNVIGGTTPAARNVISGNLSSGIRLDPGGGTLVGTAIQGNFIGTDLTGTVVVGNSQAGVETYDALDTILGGPTAVLGAAPGNVIAGNFDGVQVRNGSHRTEIQGNLIGVDVTGTVGLGHRGDGVLVLGSDDVRIGGAGAGEGNVVSASRFQAIRVLGGTGIVIQGNRIGTDSTGQIALGNGGSIFSDEAILLSGVDNPLVGGTQPGAGNLISGNTGRAALLLSGVTGGVVQGNRIGTQADGVGPLGNAQHGIEVRAGSANTIGGTDPGAGNIIAFNSGVGAFVRDPASAATIRGNAIFSNGGLGIDLSLVFEGDGVTPNDDGDADVGPNFGQNFPALSDVDIPPGAGTTTVHGGLNGVPLTTFILDFYANATADPTGFGEGQRYLGSTTVDTDATGNGSFAADLPGVIGSGELVTVTATDPAGNTSEFSAALGLGTLSATLINGNLTVADISPLGRDNRLTVRVVGTNLVISDVSEDYVGAPAGGGLSADNQELIVPLNLVTGSLTINSAGGSDTLTVDLSGVNPIPAGGLVFNGGAPTVGTGDALVIAGGDQSAVTYNYTNASDGSVVMSNFGTVTYTGLEPITNTGSATDIIFNLPAGADNAVLEDDGVVGNGLMRLRSASASFETTTFGVPTGSLTLNAGGGNDTITVASVDSLYSATLILNGDVGTDTISLNADITFAADQSLVVTAETVDVGAGADLATSGSGQIALTGDSMALAATATLVSAGTVTLVTQTAGRAISLGTEVGTSLSLTDAELDRITAGLVQLGTASSGTITIGAALSHGNNLALTTGGGITFSQAVTLAANRSLTATSTSTTAGVSFSTTTADLTASGTGEVSITATRNIALTAGASITTASGDIFLSANQQATPTTGSFVGIDITTATVGSTTGNITLLGRGGDGAAGAQEGVRVLSGGTVTGGTGGTLTLTGTGGNSSGVGNRGVRVNGTGSTVTSNGANVVVSGTGQGSAGGSSNNVGVEVSGGGRILAGGSGSVSVTGQGAMPVVGAFVGPLFGFGGNDGVLVTGGNSTITSSGGDVSVFGIGGTSATQSHQTFGVDVLLSGLITAGGTGAVNVQGIGGRAPQVSNSGIRVEGVGSAIRSSGGNLTLHGTGSDSGTSNNGVFVGNSATVAAGGVGAVSILGEGGIFGPGVAIVFDAIVTSASNVVVEGTSTTSHGIFLNSGTVSASGSGNVTLIGQSPESEPSRRGFFAANASNVFATGGTITVSADSQFIASTASITAAVVTLRQKTAGVRLSLGGADVVAGPSKTLGLTDDELDTITASVVEIGDTSSGTISITAPISPANYQTLRLGKDASFSATGGFASDITSATVHEKLEVAGILSISATATLNVTAVGGFVPAASDEFTVIENTSAGATVGAFAGKPESANVLIGGVNKSITYVGGTGNDVVLQAVEPASLVVTTELDVVANDSLTSLREAMNYANVKPGLDTISFNIPGTGVKTIRVGSSGLGRLPTITEAVILDAATQPGYAGAPLVEIDGSSAGSDGLVVVADNATIRGLIINRFAGQGISLFSSFNVLEGNYIGTDATGTVDLGNGDNGILIEGGNDNRIGGPLVEQRNVISGNEGHGIRVAGVSTSSTSSSSSSSGSGGGGGGSGGGLFAATGNLILGNFIGTNAAGSAGLGNAGSGVVLDFAATDNRIGGSDAGEGNVIANNGSAGVVLSGPDTFDNVVNGNWIGTDVTGTLDLGNTDSGIVLANGTTNNTIGGNFIAFNGDAGIVVLGEDTTFNSFRGNRSYANAGLGIDLGGDGVSANDSADSDTGPNARQNYPVVTVVDSPTPLGITKIGVTLHGSPFTEYVVELFASPLADATGFGEGQVFLSVHHVFTDETGNASFTANISPAVDLLDTGVVTATATDPDGNTSEFSLARASGTLNPTLDGGALTIADVSINGRDNQLTIRREGDHLVITDNRELFPLVPAGAALSADRRSLFIPLSSVTSLTLDLAGGSDTVTVELSDGNPIPSGGLSFLGGNGGEGVALDLLRIVGGDQGVVRYDYLNAHDGSVALSNFGLINYTGLEPIINSGIATDIIFNLPAGPNAATLGDDGMAGNGMSRLSGGTFETTDFTNPTNSLTINRGDAADALTVNALPDLAAALTIGSAASPFGASRFTGTVTLAAGNSLSVSADSVDVQAGSTLTVSGGASATVVATTVDLAGTLDAGTGTVTVQGPAGLAINVGTETAGQLSLTDAELDRITAGVVQIGDADSGAITITAEISPANYGTLRLGNSASFGATGGFAADIASATVYERVEVAGALTIAGSATLTATAVGGFVPAPADAFTLIANTSAGGTTGTFAGKPEGAIVPVGGVNKTITYAGGTGNDVVLAQANQPPTVSTNLAAVTASEGGPATNTGSFDDPQGRATVTLTASVGSVTQDTTTGLWSWTIPTTEGPAGPVNVTITATDDQGATATATFTYSVTNVAPSFDAGADEAVLSAGVFGRNAIAFTDPGTLDVHTVRVDYDGDGTIDDTINLPLGARTFDLSHTYPSPSTYTVSVALSDDDGGTLTDTFTVTVNAVPVSEAGGPYAVGEGSSAVLDGSGSSDANQAAATLTYAWDLDGDGVFAETGPDAARGDETGVSPTFSAVGLDGPSLVTVTLRVTDAAGESSLDMATVNINNVAPSVGVTNPGVTVAEAVTAINAGTFSDPGIDDVMLSSSVGNIVDNFDGTWSWSFATNDGPDQSQTVTVTATDSDGAVSTVTFNLVVTNVAPIVAANDATVTVNEGASVSTSGTIGDVGLDTVVLEASLGTIVDNGDGTWNWTFTATDGPDESQTVTITARDHDGAVSTATFALVVNNLAPSVTVLIPAVTVEEGATATNSGTFSDPGLDVVRLSASFGTVVNNGDGTWSWSKPRADGPDDTVLVVITATDGLAQTQTTFQLTVNDIVPVIDPNGSNRVLLGSTFRLNLSDVIDPGTDTVTEYWIHWGDGVTEGFVGDPANATIAYSYRGTAPMTPTIVVDLLDEDGLHLAAGSKTLDVFALPPEAPLDVAVEDSAVTRGSRTAAIVVAAQPAPVLFEPPIDLVDDSLDGDDEPDFEEPQETFLVSTTVVGETVERDSGGDPPGVGDPPLSPTAPLEPPEPPQALPPLPPPNAAFAGQSFVDGDDSPKNIARILANARPARVEEIDVPSKGDVTAKESPPPPPEAEEAPFLDAPWKRALAWFGGAATLLLGAVALALHRRRPSPPVAHSTPEKGTTP